MSGLLAELDGCVKKVKELNREMTENTDLRDDCAALGNQLVVRTRQAGLSSHR